MLKQKLFATLDQALAEANRLEDERGICVSVEKQKLCNAYALYLSQTIEDRFKKKAYLRENKTFQT